MILPEGKQTMSGEDRRRAIAGRLGAEPVAASRLAEMFGVSRQVIVQDVALLRAEGEEILSTSRGYVRAGGERPTRVFKVRHSDEEVQEELQLIVDAGGRVEDVYVWHKVYGKVRAEMGISSRREAEAFMQKIRSGISAPLKNITGGYHYHTVSAAGEGVLDDIEESLRARGFLVAREE